MDAVTTPCPVLYTFLCLQTFLDNLPFIFFHRRPTDTMFFLAVAIIAFTPLNTHYHE